MTSNAMTDGEMAQLISRALPGYNVTIAALAGARANVRVSPRGRRDVWIQIGLDDEVFVVEVDLGFRYLEFAMEGAEQEAILNDFVVACDNYLCGRWTTRRRRRILGGLREELVLPGTDSDSEVILRRT